MREQLPQRRLDWRPSSDPTEQERAVLARYMDALAAEGTEAMVQVLRADVRVSYAPLGLWADGRDDFIEASSKYAPPGEMRFLPTQANRQPAVALYLRPPGAAAFELISLEVLRIEDGQVVEIVDYSIPEVLARFGLPQTL